MPTQKRERVYIIGIGGKGLNSIAEFCLGHGYEIFGSDMKDSPEVESLRQKGVKITLVQDGSGISECDCVVYSSIIPKEHPERIRARELGIRQMSRSEFLAHVTRKFKRISVAGSHGKSTTSALATLALQTTQGGVNAITGAYIKELQSYQTTGEGPYCVVEACEYAKSFMNIPGAYTIITSLEKSHMEFFGTEQAMDNAFSEFVAAHDNGSTLVINGDVPKLRQICAWHSGPVVTCGFNQSNDYVLRDVVLGERTSKFSLYKDNERIEKNIEISLPGSYNVLNAGLVFALLYELGIETGSFREVLKHFRGVGRRFELQEHQKAIFVDDFAHHPTQVKNLMSSIRQFYPEKKIVAVLEPRQCHLYRTFLKEYGSAFRFADEVCVTDIVPALGDTKIDIEGLCVEDILDSVKIYSRPKEVWYAESYQHVARALASRDLSDTVIATIGAGPVYQVRDLIVNSVK